MITNHVLAAQGDTLNSAYATVIFLVVVIGLGLLFFGALAGVLRSDLSGGMKVVWVLFAFWAPFLGPVVWFLVGKDDAEKRHARS